MDQEKEEICQSCPLAAGLKRALEIEERLRKLPPKKERVKCMPPKLKVIK